MTAKRTLPLASRGQARAWASATFRANRRDFVTVTGLFGLATIAGLAGPQLLGYLVNEVTRGSATVGVDLLAAAFVVILLGQAILKRAARVRAGVLGERVLARTREGLVANALQLPLGDVEAAGTGDLLSRATSDVERISDATRGAIPEITIAGITTVLTVVAIVVTSPVLALGLLVMVPLLFFSTRWYWRHAPPVIERTLDAWSGVQSSTHETLEGARTAEALGLTGRRIALGERRLQGALRGQRRWRALQLRWVPFLQLSYVLPVAMVLVLGAWAHGRGLVDLGTVTTVALYVQALASPMDELLWWAEDLAVSGTALRRILGVRAPEVHRPGVAPVGQEFELRGVRFAYSGGPDVLHGIDLSVPPGQRLAIVGPSGAGKSTLGRLLAGIAAPTAGSVTIGGTEVSTMPDEVLRGEVLLLTQEHHVFAGTLRDNLTLPGDGEWRDDQLLDALDVVGARAWAESLPGRLDTTLGGVNAVPAAMAQQLALARVVLADPHTLVLDEATSLLDTTSARELERTLTTVLAGRTVIAIAHRLHTAAAADRVAVMADGRIAELGSHAELLAADGSYAHLVRAGHRS